VKPALATPLSGLRAAPEVDESAPLTPLERLEALCDPGSLELVRTRIASRSTRSAPGDGVVAGAGSVGGRPVYCYAQDQSFAARRSSGT